MEAGRAGGREGERRRSPEGPLVAQLSHLPIGSSHVLICLLVNPPVPSHPSSLIGYFALSTFVEPLCLFPSPLPSPLLLPAFSSFLFISFSPKVRSLFSSALLPSVPLGRNVSRPRSLQNEFDRHRSTSANRRGDRYNVETNYLSHARRNMRACA